MEQRPSSAAGENLRWLFGAILIALGAVALVGQLLPGGFGGLIWALIFGGMGIAFFILVPRSSANRWALIPGYVFAAIGALILLGTIDFPGELIGIFVMLAIGFPFLYVYLHNRRNWWALIPAYTMAAVAGIIALDWVGVGEGIIPSYVMFAVALPFYYVYIRDRTKWWALIPAGVMTLIGLTIFTFAAQYVMPVALIALGAFLLLRQFMGREATVQPELPKSGPQADKPLK